VESGRYEVITVDAVNLLSRAYMISTWRVFQLADALERLERIKRLKMIVETT
jgi:hypothetical protein